MIDFDDFTGEPVIKKSHNTPSLLLFGSSYKCGRVNGSKIDQLCKKHIKMVEKAVERVKESVKGGRAEEVAKEEGMGEIWDGEFVMWLCDYFLECVKKV